jgi:hypothetical protein
MEWTQEVVDKLNSVFREKYRSMSIEKKTDRANMSAIWNRYLSLYEAVVLRDREGKCDASTSVRTLGCLIDIINLQNENVAGRLAVRNPDRAGQWILISRDIAERILVFGML